jgi:hypothetical protein
VRIGITREGSGGVPALFSVFPPYPIMFKSLGNLWDKISASQDRETKFKNVRRNMETVGEHPDDVEPDYDKAIRAIASILDPVDVRWFVAGDIMLQYYDVALEPRV